MHTATLTTHLNTGLVVLSVAVAIVASYAALNLVERSTSTLAWRRPLGIAGAGLTMGAGIWSMHFIGMLALQMGMQVSYSTPLAALSLLVAVAGASVSLAVASRPQVSRRGLLSAAAFMGLAIAAMHYLGMASMQMDAVIRWNVALIILSLAVGFTASLFALWLIVQIRVRVEGLGSARRLGAAVLLGLGVAGLHYTAMTASTFELTDDSKSAHHALDTNSLVIVLVISAAVMLAVLIGSTRGDQRRAALADDLSLVLALARSLARVGGARQRVCQTIQEMAGADFVALVEPASGDRMAVTATSGLMGQAESSDLADDPHVRSGFDSGRYAFVSDLTAESEASSRSRQPRGAASALYEPLCLDGRPIGMLVVSWRRRLHRLPERSTTLLSMLAAEAAIAIDRENLLSKLEYLSRRDELTGLLNRRVLGEELDLRLAEAIRHERPLSVVMLDVDHFKDYNDTHGHQAGDRLLRSAAAAWSATLRQTDTIARYGGEEFVVILPDCPRESAVLSADRLRGAVPSGATCSAGVATLEAPSTAAELIDRADRALYEAKDAGRNRTRAYIDAARVASVDAGMQQAD